MSGIHTTTIHYCSSFAFLYLTWNLQIRLPGFQDRPKPLSRRWKRRLFSHSFGIPSPVGMPSTGLGLSGSNVRIPTGYVAMTQGCGRWPLLGRKSNKIVQPCCVRFKFWLLQLTRMKKSTAFVDPFREYLQKISEFTPRQTSICRCVSPARSLSHGVFFCPGGLLHSAQCVFHLWHLDRGRWSLRNAGFSIVFFFFFRWFVVVFLEFLPLEMENL